MYEPPKSKLENTTVLSWPKFLKTKVMNVIFGLICLIFMGVFFVMPFVSHQQSGKQEIILGIVALLFVGIYVLSFLSLSKQDRFMLRKYAIGLNSFVIFSVLVLFSYMFYKTGRGNLLGFLFYIPFVVNIFIINKAQTIYRELIANS